MMKKIIGAVAGAGLVLTMAGSAFAYWHMPSIDVENEDTFVITKGISVANSGLNSAGFFGDVTTGNASGVFEVRNDVNYTEVGRTFMGVDVENEDTFVITKGISAANTGLNRASLFGDVTTGNAAARITVVNGVNWTVVAPTAL